MTRTAFTAYRASVEAAKHQVDQRQFRPRDLGIQAVRIVGRRDLKALAQGVEKTLQPLRVLIMRMAGHRLGEVRDRREVDLRDGGFHGDPFGDWLAAVHTGSPAAASEGAG